MQVQPRPTIVGLGEFLWDMLPSGKQLGGAPANFAYCSHLLGNRGVIVSRAGNDDLGSEARTRLRQAGISDEFIQSDLQHPTGTVKVDVDAGGQPTFEIVRAVAWDFLEWSNGLESLAQSADAVCFGTLAQRSPRSRATILKFLNSTRAQTARVFDVNLRQSFYSREIVFESLRRATVLKLNDHELPTLAGLLGVAARDFGQTVLNRFKIQLICITRGEHGSILMDRTGTSEHPGFRIVVKDAVGAGDAFTAGLVHQFLRRAPLDAANDTANRMGAWVASCSGAMPEAPEQGLLDALAGLQAQAKTSLGTG